MRLSPSRLHRSKAFSIPGLPGHYPLTVYLPPGYGHSAARYPVAYMFDGQNLFKDQGSYSGGWHMHLTLDHLATQGKTVPIVVGIHHGGASRIEELTPWAAQRGKQPRLEALLSWMNGRLAEMVNEEMRTLTGPANTMVGGASLGGLAALYAATRFPHIYGRALVMSPSLWVGGGAIFEMVRHAPYGPDTRIYLDCGGREGPGQTIVAAERMSRLLQMKGLADGERLMWRPDAKGAHNERNWRRRLPKAMRFLYRES